MTEICRNCKHCKPSYKKSICEISGKKTTQKNTCERWESKK